MSNEQTDVSVTPVLISAVKSLDKNLKSAGLSDDDIIHLIHKRCKGNATKSQIRTTLSAVRQLVKDIARQRS